MQILLRGTLVTAIVTTVAWQSAVCQAQQASTSDAGASPSSQPARRSTSAQSDKKSAATNAVSTGANEASSGPNATSTGADAVSTGANAASAAKRDSTHSVMTPANPASAAKLSPGKAYMEIHKKELEAKCYEDLIPLRSKNSIAHDKFNSAAERQQFFPLFKMLLVHDVQLIDEKVDGDRAVVHVSAERKDDKMVESSTGEINLTWEDGQWKLDTEDWKSKIESK